MFTTPTVVSIESTYFLTRTMRCPKQPLARDFQQMQYPQHLGTPGFLWPPCPPQPVYNPWIIPPQYPTAGSMPPHYSQLLPQVSGSGERPLLFQALVEAVSKEIKKDDKVAAAADGCKKAASADLSVQDQMALIDALKRQKDRELTMQQVFEELSQKHGHPEAVWKTWFFANYEKLNHNLIPNPNVGCALTGKTGSNASSSHVASRTRSASNNLLSRSSATTATNENERTHSRNEESEWEDLTPDDQGSTYGDSDFSAGHDASQSHASTNTQHTTAPTACSGKPRVMVTDEDLRAMAQYRFEKGDNDEIRRYSYPRWREFAERPENRKRSLAAWTCVPRVRSHADAINQYLREFQLLAEGGTDSKAGLLSSLGGAGEQRRVAIDIDVVTSQKEMETANKRNGGFKENEASPPVDMEIIDLTVETEDY